MNKMNKLTATFGVLLLMFGSVSCKKEKTAQTNEGEMKITASIVQPTAGDKTQINGSTGAVTWVAGDQIKLYSDANGTSTTPVTLTLESGVGTASGSFTGDYPGGPNYYATYGSVTRSSGGTFTATVPASQDGTLKGSNAPMISDECTGGSIQFRNVASWLALNINCEQGYSANITQVVVKSTSKQPLAGSFNVKVGKDGKVECSSIEKARSTTITISKSFTLKSTATTVYVLVPAGSFSDENGFTIELYQNGTLLKADTKSFWVNTGTAANTIYKANITEKLDFVPLYGDKWATRNLGATNPWDYGDYYYWAEGPKARGNDNDWAPKYTIYTGTVSGWRWSGGFVGGKEPYYDSGDWSISGYNFNVTFTKYNTANTVLANEDDVAQTITGGVFKIPTPAQLTSNLLKVSKKETTIGGKKGFLFYDGTNYSSDPGNSIFLPHAGYVVGTGVEAAGSTSIYLSNTTYPDVIYPGIAEIYGYYNFTALQYDPVSGRLTSSPQQRRYGYTIRPVIK